MEFLFGSSGIVLVFDAIHSIHSGVILVENALGKLGVVEVVPTEILRLPPLRLRLRFSFAHCHRNGDRHFMSGAS